MTKAVRELPVVIYIDDLITGGSTREKHEALYRDPIVRDRQHAIESKGQVHPHL